ncbi:MAG: hypothetical protein ACK58Z_00835 [Pseudanabaena sp.]
MLCSAETPVDNQLQNDIPNLLLTPNSTPTNLIAYSSNQKAIAPHHS